MNAGQVSELVLTVVVLTSGVLILCFRRRLANCVLSDESPEERSGWKKAVPMFFSLLGQVVLIWGIVHALRQFGIAVESAAP
jgi:hypothetical protein